MAIQMNVQILRLSGLRPGPGDAFESAVILIFLVNSQETNPEAWPAKCKSYF